MYYNIRNKETNNREVKKMKLNGTEKQIKYANDIINDALNTCQANIDRMTTSKAPIYEDMIQAFKECKKALEDSIKDVTEASIIIENKSQFNTNRIIRMVERRTEEIAAERNRGKGNE